MAYSVRSGNIYNLLYIFFQWPSYLR